MNVMIVGANFDNKGAQSMLFITIDEIKKRFPQSNVFFASTEIWDKSIYNFNEVYYSDNAKHIALNKKRFYNQIKCFVKDSIKLIIGRKNLWRSNELSSLCTSLDLIIDVSGFNLGIKWDVYTHEAYFDNIRLARKYNVPMVLMPQSFGPFNYDKNKIFLLDEMKELLTYPKIIFAREHEGYKQLKELFNLRNVVLSTDIVLQNKSVDLNNIYLYYYKKDLPVVSENAVGIIPNQQCFNHGLKEKIFELYKEILIYLSKLGKKVYIFRHSKSDLAICRELFNMCNNSKNIILLEEELSCFEYDQFIKRFDFIICSRYHGIVHGYRNFIPAILLGWSAKYQELARNVGQEKYSFDITDFNFSIENVIEAIDDLNHHMKDEAKIIHQQVDKIQENNCFSFMFENVKIG